MSKATNTDLKQRLNSRRQNDLLNPERNVAGRPLLSEGQKKYREELILKAQEEEDRPRKMGRPKQATFPEAWKGFKESPDYQRLYAAIQNREFVIEHLIWRAFQAGYKAK